MTKKRVLIFGGIGMLGTVFRETQSGKFDIIPVSHDDCDITNFPLVLNQISLSEPVCIVNFAAYTDVEKAEGEGIMKAFSTNALGAQNIAQAASAFGVPLIFLSTDYVFDGEKKGGYLPTDIPHPINNYGMGKYLGEELTKKEYSEAIIIRTSALYGGPLFGEKGWKRNFINSLLSNSQKNLSLKIVKDQYTLPTSCFDLSDAITSVIEQYDEYYGTILHLANTSDNDGLVSWYDFAVEIQKHLPELGVIMPIDSLEYPSKVRRPQMSILKNTSPIILPDWREAVGRYFGGRG